MGMDTKGLEAVIMPLINSMAPKKIEPQCKLCKLIKELVEGELGKNLQSELILRFVIHTCEEDPGKMWVKLEEIHAKVSMILSETLYKEREE